MEDKSPGWGPMAQRKSTPFILFAFSLTPPLLSISIPSIAYGAGKLSSIPSFWVYHRESALQIFTLYLKTSLWYLLYCLFPLSFWTLGFITISNQMAHSLSCICHRLYKRNGQPERPPELRPKCLNHPLVVGCSTGHNPSSSYTSNNFFFPKIGSVFLGCLYTLMYVQCFVISDSKRDET